MPNQIGSKSKQSHSGLTELFPKLNEIIPSLHDITPSLNEFNHAYTKQLQA